MDDLSSGARSLLQAAEMYDDPSAEDATRVRRAVLTRVGAIGITAAVVAASSTQAKAASVMSLAAKFTAALAVTAGGVAASWTYVNQEPEPPAMVAPAPVTKVKAKLAPAAMPAPAEAAVVADDLKVEEVVPAVKRAARLPRVEPEKVEPPKPEPTPADLEAEMKLIRGADAALRAGRSGEALALLGQHQTEHPRASLAHEREGLRAIAQCQVGAPGSAAAAQRFVERAPRSPLAPRLRSACRIGE